MNKISATTNNTLSLNGFSRAAVNGNLTTMIKLESNENIYLNLQYLCTRHSAELLARAAIKTTDTCQQVVSSSKQFPLQHVSASCVFQQTVSSSARVSKLCLPANRFLYSTCQQVVSSSKQFPLQHVSASCVFQQTVSYTARVSKLCLPANRFLFSTNIFHGNMAQLCLLIGMVVLSSLVGHGICILWGETEREPDTSRDTDNFVCQYRRPVLCGRRPAARKAVQARDVDDGLDKIIGGRTTRHGQYPWTVNIYDRTRRKGAPNGHTCGGAIISEYWVLTAALCLRYGKRSSLSIVVGDFDADIKDEGEQRFLVDQFIPHEQYNLDIDLEYNIALIKVANTSDGRGIRFNDYVQPICLPDYGETCSHKKSVVVTGWGSASTTSTKSVRLLKRVSLRCKSDSFCRRNMEKSVELSDRVFCTGDKHRTRDACDGDTGGPGAMKNGSVFVLAGIISHGTFCELPDDPVIFSSVSAYLDWIITTIASNSDFEERIIPSRT
ncbi:hypothetical protein BsWGS_27385 [Bradybaena similaris]